MLPRDKDTSFLPTRETKDTRDTSFLPTRDTKETSFLHRDNRAFGSFRTRQLYQGGKTPTHNFPISVLTAFWHHPPIIKRFTTIWEDLPWWLSHQKTGNCSPSLCPYWGLFNYICCLLVISSEPIIFSYIWCLLVISSEPIICKNMMKKIFAVNDQSNLNFLKFWIDNFQNLISHKLEELFT